eukprot:scaffold4484_cov98-Isochrysis_galbana.AAC.6
MRSPAIWPGPGACPAGVARRLLGGRLLPLAPNAAQNAAGLGCGVDGVRAHVGAPRARLPTVRGRRHQLIARPGLFRH